MVGALMFELSLHLTDFVSDHQSTSVCLARAQETEIGCIEKILDHGETHRHANRITPAPLGDQVLDSQAPLGKVA